MQYFFELIIKPYLTQNRYQDILEIGSEFGGNTEKLLLIPSTKVWVVDPCLSADLETKFKNQGRVKLLKQLSLEVLPKISETFDAMLIDGDHNWYTVFNELKTIEERHLINPGGTIFLHDVCWPYGRRDMYYVPESIPETFRHPYAKKGMREGKSELLETGGDNAALYNACHEGGVKNGVLTAVEDFLHQYGKDYLFYYLKEEYGLGILVRKKNLGTTFMAIKWFCMIEISHFFRRVAGFLKNRFNQLLGT